MDNAPGLEKREVCPIEHGDFPAIAMPTMLYYRRVSSFIAKKNDMENVVTGTCIHGPIS